MVRSDEQMLAASGEVERPSKTDCVAIRAQSLSAPQDRIGHAYVHGALDLLGDRQRAGVHGLRHGARCCRDLPRDRRHRRLDVSSWPSTSVRCVAAIFPESEVDRTRRGHGENGAHGAAGTDGRPRLDIISS